MTVTRAHVPDARERTRRYVPMRRTQADRVADERAYARTVSRCFGADVQRLRFTRVNRDARKCKPARHESSGSRRVQPQVGRRPSHECPAPIMTNDEERSAGNVLFGSCDDRERHLDDGDPSARAGRPWTNPPMRARAEDAGCSSSR